MIDILIDATIIFAAVYITAALISKAVRFTPVTPQGKGAVDVEPEVEDEGLSDAEKWEILGQMTLTHLRKLAIAYNASNPAERIARAARLRKDEAIPALVARWNSLQIETRLEKVG